jgi:hypothetical protein
MAVITNTTVQADIDKVITIDFVNQFGNSIGNFAELLGITRRMPVAEGFTIKRYTQAATMASGIVTEGDEIPLSKITLEEADPVVLTLEEYRKLVTAQTIQNSGRQAALEDTDDRMRLEIQKIIRGKFFTTLGTGTGSRTATNFQGAVAQAWGFVQNVFEDDGVDTVAFVNTDDVADYLGSAALSLQNVFGLNYVSNFLNTRMFASSRVPKGTVYATAPQNLVLAYVDVRGGELANLFELTTDEFGFIGMTREPVKARMSIETVMVSGVTFFAENLAGVGKITITPPSNG